MPRAKAPGTLFVCMNGVHMDDFQRKWKQIQDQLAYEMNGKQPHASTARTIFGIKSEAEKKMEKFARQINEEQLADMRRQSKSEANHE